MTLLASANLQGIVLLNKFKDPIFSGLVNSWMQSLGILVAAVWGVYTFIYLDIIVPHTSPVNVSLDIAAKKTLPPNNRANSFITMQVDVTAENPSTRSVSVLPGIWLAYGKKVGYTPDESNFKENLYTALNTHNEMYVEKYMKTYDLELVAGGNLFHDNILNPKERKTRNFVFFVPNKKYDLIEVRIIVPHTERKNIYLEWVYNHEVNAPFYEIYHQDVNGDRIIMNEDELNEFRNDNFGTYYSSVVVPLLKN